ncbi:MULTISPECIES: LysE family translocator [Acinetobacter]|uniref:LysE family translocator n=1 Tax=Acinetobacter pecorum TaxID=2762215 RepID=A0ABR8VUA8_9GAMM|nr:MULTISPECIES: LysE family translocator [Acinetobacter]MBD8008360.1 LysE family translocator [Acinetobacter pecorum]OAL78120.1 amino acid transporter [Acinetobacter sp. SFA]
MNISEYILYCLAVVLMIATPGPVMLLVASTGLKGGYAAALRTIFGTNFASLVLIALSILSLKGLLVINAHWLDAIKLLGCLYIGYLGLQIFREVFFEQAESIQEKLSPVRGGFQQGFLVGISNPKDIIFFAAFFPQFIGITPTLDLSLIMLTLSWIVLDFLTLSLVYLGFNRLRHSRLYPHLLALCGMVLVIIAIYGIYQVLI